MDDAIKTEADAFAIPVAETTEELQPAREPAERDDGGAGHPRPGTNGAHTASASPTLRPKPARAGEGADRPSHDACGVSKDSVRPSPNRQLIERRTAAATEVAALRSALRREPKAELKKLKRAASYIAKNRVQAEANIDIKILLADFFLQEMRSGCDQERIEKFWAATIAAENPDAGRRIMERLQRLIDETGMTINARV